MAAVPPSKATVAGLNLEISAAAADDSLMTAANIAKNAGDGRGERAALRQLVKNYPDSELRAEALFRLFWSHRLEGRPDRGLVYLDTLAKDYDGQRGDGADSDRGRYWWGRTVAASARKADRPQGLEFLGRLSRERPFTYYGVLARSFLGSMNAKVAFVPESIEPHKGELRLACHLAEMAVQAAPGDMHAHAVRASVYGTRRKAEASLMAKGIYGFAERESTKAVTEHNQPKE